MLLTAASQMARYIIYARRTDYILPPALDTRQPRDVDEARLGIVPVTSIIYRKQKDWYWQALFLQELIAPMPSLARQLR